MEQDSWSSSLNSRWNAIPMPGTQKTNEKWSDEELKALVGFVFVLQHR